MATYTTMIRSYIESFSRNNPNLSTRDKIMTGIPKLFDWLSIDDWYCNDPQTLANFEYLFTIHYYMREIGFETIGLFKLQLESLVKENMPEYTDLYYSISQIGNLLENVNMTTKDDLKINRESDADTESTSTDNTNTSDHSVTNSQGITSDVPQVNFAGQDFASGMARGKDENEKNSTIESDSTGTAHAESTSQDVHDGTHKTWGWQGSKMGEIVKYRNNIVNLNKRIITDCEPLFMGVFNDFAMHGNDFNMVTYGDMRYSIDWMR